MKPHEKLGVAIADAGYAWTSEMRSAWEELDKEIEALKADKDRITRDLIGASFYEHDYKTLMAKPPLTDEEIDYCWNHSHGNTPWMKQKAFARAILRKAQEK